jgi:hypothetical protein
MDPTWGHVLVVECMRIITSPGIPMHAIKHQTVKCRMVCSSLFSYDHNQNQLN